ncbi:ABC transporter substrate-binding protein [Alkalicoccobacillus murimartini]|uniref:Multiple sugar transport system substrate-binding protein n=1 Tax=Alkalicoccobacillus murimartini TaxID=171685 RepID=A0ABT9YHA3_9BACI|nr:extracellular solute-binding protein [Alkalicoccobacillus murimartini]MDQ0207246.1 multiple sugar transport system substrate-binding protein [Alkalicoccobacillus murimartini]
MNKLWGSMAGVTALTLVMVGCTPGGPTGGNEGSEDGQTVIRVSWWGADERHNMTTEAIALFEEKNPDIKVEPEYTGFDSYWERLTTQAAGSNLPDVIQMDTSKLEQYISSELVLDLNDLIEEGTINMDDVDDVYQEMNIKDGGTFAIAAGANAFSTLYNEALFEEYDINLEPGYTYDDLYEAMDKVSQGEGDNAWGFDFVKAEYEAFTHYARQFEQHLYGEDGKLGFEDQTLIDFLTMEKNMIDNGVSTPHDVTVEINDSGESMIANREAAMAVGASNGVIGIQPMSEDPIGVNVLPVAEGATSPGDWIRPSMSFSISAASEQQEAAGKFIDFLTNDIEGNEILMAERGVPISTEVRTHLMDQVDESVAKTFEFLDIVGQRAGEPEPLPPAGEAEVRASFNRMLEAVKYGDMTPEEGVEVFRSEAEQILG